MKFVLLAAAALIAAPAMAQDQAPASSAPTTGGYQPSGPALQGTPAPGATVRFQQAPDPNTAFPPPAAQDSYPVCKKGQFDGCRQVGNGDGFSEKGAGHEKHAVKKHARHHAKKSVSKTTTTTTTKTPTPAK